MARTTEQLNHVVKYVSRVDCPRIGNQPSGVGNDLIPLTEERIKLGQGCGCAVFALSGECLE